MKIFASLAAASAVLLIAGAASAGDARIAFGDLDLASAAGAAAFDARIDRAADRLCAGARRQGSLVGDREFCRTAVRAEAVRQLPGRAQVDYALGRVPLVV